jgi:hypothetical protein
MTAFSAKFNITFMPFPMVETMYFTMLFSINNGFKIRILDTGQKYWLSDIYDR